MRFTSSPTTARIPNSSSNSRRSASRGCSPSSIFPPGNSHLSGMVWCRVRWHTNTLPFFSITAATTLFMIWQPLWRAARRPPDPLHTSPGPFQRSSSLLEFLSHHFGAVLDELLILAAKRRREVAIDVELAGDFPVHKNRHHNFGLGFERTGQIARIFADIVDNNRLSAGGSSPANSLVQRNSRVRGHRPHERFQHQRRRLGPGLEHVKANPVVLKHALMQELTDALHQILGRRCGLSERRDFVANFFDSGGNRHDQNLNSERQIHAVEGGTEVICRMPFVLPKSSG